MDQWREQKTWPGEYFPHSRAAWDPQALFAPVLQQGLACCPGKLAGVAVDDTRLPKTGRKIPQAGWQRNPMSPPFHTNLMLGLRFLQASLLLPLQRTGSFSARAIPIRLEEGSTVTKSTFVPAPLIMGKDFDVQMRPFIEIAKPSAFEWKAASDKTS